MAEELNTGDMLDALIKLENLFRPCADARRIAESFSRLEGQAGQLEREVSAAQAKKVEVDADLAKAEETLAAKKDELQEACVKLNRIQDGLHAQERKLENDRVRIGGEIADAERKRAATLLSMDKAATDHRAQLKDMTERMAVLQATYSSMEKTKDDLEGKIKVLQDQLDALRELAMKK